MMPIEDDAWGAPVPEPETKTEDEGTTPSPVLSRFGPRPRTPLLLAGAAVVVIAIVVVIVVAGSGGSSGLSKAAWIQKADVICGQIFPQESADESQNNLSGEISLAQQALTRIQALGLPSQGADLVKSFEQQQQQATDLLKQAIAAAASDPTTAQNDQQQADSLIQSALSAAGRLGMQVCNSGQ